MFLRFFLKVVALLFVFFVVFGFGLGATVTVQAQENITEQPVPDGAEAIENDSRLYVEDASYNSETGQMSLDLFVLEDMDLVLTDAGAGFERGPVSRQRFSLQEGNNTVTLPVTKRSGKVGVQISTTRTTYGYPIQIDRQWITGSPSITDYWVGLLGAFLAVVLVASSGAIYYRYYKGGVSHDF